MKSHLPPSPLRVCGSAAFPLRWLATRPNPVVTATYNMKNMYCAGLNDEVE